MAQADAEGLHRRLRVGAGGVRKRGALHIVGGVPHCTRAAWVAVGRRAAHPVGQSRGGLLVWFQGSPKAAELGPLSAIRRPGNRRHVPAASQVDAHCPAADAEQVLFHPILRRFAVFGSSTWGAACAAHSSRACPQAGIRRRCPAAAAQPLGIYRRPAHASRHNLPCIACSLAFLHQAVHAPGLAAVQLGANQQPRLNACDRQAWLGGI